jgi:DUF1680 family protein
MKKSDYSRREFIELMALGAAASAAPVWFGGCDRPAATPEGLQTVTPVPFTDVRFTDTFWARRVEVNRTVTIPYDFKKCEETGRIDNFSKAAGLLEGPFRGIRYDDSDVFKVMEGAAYSLSLHPDQELEKYLEDLIEKVAAAQEEDGYLYTARTAPSPEPVRDIGPERWSFLAQSHELYNVGHLYEAAVAHYQATGRRSLLDVALKNADLIDTVFGPDGLHDIPGHQEIEIGLTRLYRVTGERRYLDLAKFFLDQRGRADRRELYGEYFQDHLPVTEQTEAVGHAVRAGYMYTAMADVATLTGERSYVDAIDRLWEDVVSTKLYITGGIGASRRGEAFGEAYDLPNRSAYAETCAAIANAMWNHRMFLLHADARYIDVLERVIYNGFLSGISMEGNRFFYPNPLESNGKYLFNHGAAERQPWFGTSCCPVNVARFVPSIAGYVYGVRGSDVYVNLFVGGEAAVQTESGGLIITQETNYPWDGHVRLTLEPEAEGRFALHVRIPGWAMNQPVPSDLYRFLETSQEDVILKVNGESEPLEIEKGYAVITREWTAGDTIDLELPMPVRKIVAHENVKADAGRVALQRGPLVYCVEGVDHGGQALNLFLPDDVPVLIEDRPDLLGGVVVLRANAGAVRRSENGGEPEVVPAAITAIPYYAWNHRGVGEMAVWIPRTPEAVVLPPLPTLASMSTATASHVYGSDSPAALNDQEEPASSNDHTIPRFTWWDHKGTTEWVQYDFPKSARVSAVEVYWFDDAPSGGCRLPASWRVLYRKGEAWEPVTVVQADAISKDRYNRLTFEPVETDALRLEVQLQPDYSAGILEWLVEE